MCDVIECSCNLVFPVYGERGAEVKCPRCGVSHIIGESEDKMEAEE